MGAKYNDGRETPDMADQGGGTNAPYDYSKSLGDTSMGNLKKGHKPMGKMSHEETCSDGDKPA